MQKALSTGIMPDGQRMAGGSGGGTEASGGVRAGAGDEAVG